MRHNHRDMEKEALDLSAIRARLAQAKGRRYWRSLEEIAETPAFKEFLYREFPQGAAEWTDQLSRRSFLKVMGASLALAGLTSCSGQLAEKILPYVRQPEELIPGKPLFYASAMTLGGYATGVLVESHEGRPTKIEGNPDHPASLGSSDPFMQASILELYDPDRSQVVTRFGTRISTWDAFIQSLQTELDSLQANQGAGLRILTGLVTSPTLTSQLDAILAEFPQAKWHQYEPAGSDNARAGARLAFGRDVETIYNLAKADVVLSLDANFLGEGPAHIRYARDFSDKRRVWTGQTTQNRLYVVESTPSITGAKADHRLPLRASQMELFARAVAEAVGVKVGGAELAEHADWIAAVAGELQSHRGTGLVIAGNQQPPIVHALAHALNEALGNVGQTVLYTDPVAANPVDEMASLRELAEDMAADRVQLLIILDRNPVYEAPADLQFAELMFKVKTRIHLGLYEDETAELCQWHIPGLHYLEMWGDARAYDGTVSIIQPLIAPLYDGKSAYELLAAVLGQTGVSNLDLVRGYWQGQSSGGDFEARWRTALHNGIMADTTLPATSVSVQADFGSAPQAVGPQSLEIVFRPDPSVWDGCFANNGWLQELPKPMTKITWDNVALVSPATAERLGLSNEQVVELRYRERSVRAPVWITPGHADNSVTVHLGFGRSRAGSVGNGVGFNAYTLRTSEAPWFDTGLEISPTSEQYSLVTTQQHFNMEGRELVRTATLADYQARPDFAQEHSAGEGKHISLYPEYEYDGNAWGMTIDLTTCIGCNACTIACQAENNIPVVGKDQVLRGREMHWIRVDTYFEGELDNPAAHFQPVPCMHCEKAPCELVCPVVATVHDAEGLNNMVYNRCVGTRYCSNNCPYKVRRFNFLQYSNEDVPVLKLLMNPDVTVRQRGVMEKCTYCVQRINAARIEAKKENRAIRDGEIVTACQQACPTQAIIFGNINDKGSQVAQSKATPLNYGLLVELNTEPRTTYLAEVKNPNAELGGKIS
ncbi:MAG: TAT-variant-translocated molybdopterin oxidoreductase [Acidobacteria bacterium]|nr:TAT-variant-translocated molybdopterin oxidoreductase [Acidobacteriota bacterium]